MTPLSDPFIQPRCRAFDWHPPRDKEAVRAAPARRRRQSPCLPTTASRHLLGDARSPVNHSFGAAATKTTVFITAVSGADCVTWLGPAAEGRPRN